MEQQKVIVTVMFLTLATILTLIWLSNEAVRAELHEVEGLRVQIDGLEEQIKNREQMIIELQTKFIDLQNKKIKEIKN